MKRFGLLLLTASIVALGGASAAQASPAVVLVSGFDTSTPFSTSAPNCAGKEGPTWNPATGVAAALKQAGYAVFTAPVLQSDTPPPPSCVSPAQLPPAAATIHSNGELDANGRALIALLRFLATNYGVTSVQLVGHSDGGLWSRSAITQVNANPVNLPIVQSLTTLGTPHTGSFGADLAVTLDNDRCEQPDRIERLLCDLVLDIIEAEFRSLGPEALKQLTYPFLAGWNPRQTIGCPVGVIGGTWLNVPIGYPYYDPDDGIVGIASALAAGSRSIGGVPIPPPGFPVLARASYPVVHSETLHFLSPDNLLNQAVISGTVLKFVRQTGLGSPCAAAGAPPSPSPRPLLARPAPSVAFQSLEVPSDGSLSRPTTGEAVVLARGASLRCGRQRIAATSLLGSHRVRVAFPRCRGALRTDGRRVLALRSDRRRALQASHDGRRLHLRVTGPPLRRVRAEARVGGRWVPVKARGSTPLILRRGRVTVRASGQARNGRRVSAVAHVIRGTLR